MLVTCSRMGAGSQLQAHADCVAGLQPQRHRQLAPWPQDGVVVILRLERQVVRVLLSF